MDTFTETSTAPDQAVNAAANHGEQGPSSISEAVSHPDATIQQHIVGDVMSSGRENGKKSRKPRISETITLNDGSCASITLLFTFTELKLSQLHVTTPLRNEVNVAELASHRRIIDAIRRIMEQNSFEAGSSS